MEIDEALRRFIDKIISEEILLFISIKLRKGENLGSIIYLM